MRARAWATNVRGAITDMDNGAPRAFAVADGELGFSGYSDVATHTSGIVVVGGIDIDQWIRKLTLP